jgi:hypothetical protein
MAEESNMNQPAEIKQHIEAERGQLHQSLNELEYRVRRATDWRAQFEKRPSAFVGAALCAGFFLGIITKGNGSRESRVPGNYRRCYCE